jgi:hypothetical protein
MPTKYPNLPGTFVELLDGNLQIDQTISGPVALVIGTAFSGPSDFQYLVKDSNAASAIYGSESPLVKALSQVKLGGATNIVLYRVGGKAAEIVDIFGEESSIRTREETAGAGSKYSFYIGPEPSNALVSCIIAFEGDKIVYSDVTGSEVDLGVLEIIGFDKETFTGIVGSPTVPVAMASVVTSVLDDNTLTQTGDAIETTYDLAPAAGAVVKSAQVDGVDATYTMSAGTGTDGVDQIVFDTAPVDTGGIVVQYTTPSATVATFSAGADNVASSLKTKYELLDQAYADLETTIATGVTIALDGVILDAANIADGSADADRLEYLYKEEEFGEFTYKWGTDKVLYSDGASGTTSDSATAAKDANGQAIVAEQYSEVNFAHQLGTWCHSITENERFVLGSIGVSLPKSTNTSSVARWIGTLPQTNVNGAIISDGSGLLGNRFMSGSTTQTPGFYHTDSGFPDGNTQADSNGAPVDLGKYISIVSGAVVTPALASLGSAVGIANCANIYSGILTTVPGGESTTNRTVPRVSLPFSIKKTKLDELAGAGYVALTTKPTGEVAVVSGELPTGPHSDYDYVSTTIIIAEIVKEIRERMNPFLGKGLNTAMIAAMETATETILQAKAVQGSINNYAFNVVVQPTVNGQGKVSIPLTIVPAFELREVSVPIKLAYEI